MPYRSPQVPYHVRRLLAGSGARSVHAALARHGLAPVAAASDPSPEADVELAAEGSTDVEPTEAPKKELGDQA